MYPCLGNWYMYYCSQTLGDIFCLKSPFTNNHLALGWTDVGGFYIMPLPEHCRGWKKVIFSAKSLLKLIPGRLFSVPYFPWDRICRSLTPDGPPSCWCERDWGVARRTQRSTSTISREKGDCEQSKFQCKNQVWVKQNVDIFILWYRETRDIFTHWIR